MAASGDERQPDTGRGRRAGEPEDEADRGGGAKLGAEHLGPVGDREIGGRGSAVTKFARRDDDADDGGQQEEFPRGGDRLALAGPCGERRDRGVTGAPRVRVEQELVQQGESDGDAEQAPGEPCRTQLPYLRPQRPHHGLTSTSAPAVS